jgi:Protein of unknown function (DUF4230)
MRRGVTTGGLVSAFTISVVICLPFAFWILGIRPPGFARAAMAPPPALSLIQSMNELATTRVHISDTIEGANNDYRGKWTLHGECILGVNLAEAAYLQSRPEKREAVLRLPQPHLISSKVDHERSEELYINWVSWMPLSSKQLLRDAVWKHADYKLQRLAHDQGYLERAKVQAERALHQLFQGVGWNVSFEWEGGSPPLIVER